MNFTFGMIYGYLPICTKIMIFQRFSRGIPIWGFQFFRSPERLEKNRRFFINPVYYNYNSSWREKIAPINHPRLYSHKWVLYIYMDIFAQNSVDRDSIKATKIFGFAIKFVAEVKGIRLIALGKQTRVHGEFSGDWIWRASGQGSTWLKNPCEPLSHRCTLSSAYYKSEVSQTGVEETIPVYFRSS